MGWNVYGQRIDTADVGSTPVYYQKFEPVKNEFIVAVRTWVIFYNNPVLTSLEMKVYANRNGSPGKLLYTSASRLKASMITGTYGVKEVYFEFSAPGGVQFKSGDAYFFVLSATGYTGVEGSHIAWRKAFPNPLLSSGASLDYTDVGVSPYYIAPISGEV